MQASKPAEPTLQETASNTLSDVKDKALEFADTAKKTVSDTFSNASIKAEQLLDDVNRIANENIKHAIETTKEKESISNEEVPKPKLDEGNFKLGIFFILFFFCLFFL